MSSLEKYLFKCFAYFKIRFILSCFVLFLAIELYILDVSPLPDIWPANTFSHFVSYFLTLLIVSIAVQKLFSFDVFPLVYFCFCCSVFDVIYKKSLPIFRKIQIKIIVGYLTPGRIPIIKNFLKDKLWRACGHIWNPCTMLMGM